jgi:hypothetical protein
MQCQDRGILSTHRIRGRQQRRSQIALLTLGRWVAGVVATFSGSFRKSNMKHTHAIVVLKCMSLVLCVGCDTSDPKAMKHAHSLNKSDEDCIDSARQDIRSSTLPVQQLMWNGSPGPLLESSVVSSLGNVVEVDLSAMHHRIVVRFLSDGSPQEVYGDVALLEKLASTLQKFDSIVVNGGKWLDEDAHSTGQKICDLAKVNGKCVVFIHGVGLTFNGEGPWAEVVVGFVTKR